MYVISAVSIFKGIIMLSSFTLETIRKNITRLTSTTPSNFQFRTVVDEQGRQKSRLYFLGDMDKRRESTLLKVDIPGFLRLSKISVFLTTEFIKAYTIQM